ncbi:MAG: glycine--tRNA ligase subunit beta [Candidatus Cloacimonadales bacterium]|nr:glycine--tRNA ligase subunit beta [Candidatus Cloacimonadales bacterium]
MPIKDFLLELGVEEIPAGYIAAAINKIEEHFRKGLAAKKLSFSNLKTFSTPRRFAIKITDLQTKQSDEIIERIGPAKTAAYDAEGNLTKAALGFLRGANANPEDIFLVESTKGEKIAVKKEIAGQETAEIIKQLIVEIIENISFPKSMKWGSSSLNFARPIRWLLVLFGNEVIPLDFQGIQSNNISFGNRWQRLENPVEINSIEEYEEKLESVFVIADRDKRKTLIQKQIDELFSNTNDQIVTDENLLEIVTDLVEYPTAVIANFSENYLQLPQKVITSTLSQHQKYFAVQDAKGDITNKFVFISNGDKKYSELIKLGNEKVITARLEDAGFFFKEDTSVSLESFVPKLAEVTFQEQLGSLLEKTERLKNIVDFISKKINANTEINVSAQRAAFLCKADLVTQMLGEKEFTKLQGYMGREYAVKSGESLEVAKAIYEHYLPRGERDELPASIAGAILAIADKMDTVCGIIGVDMIPTGSRDPFALRRAANGIVQTIDKFDFELNLSDLIYSTFKVLKDKLPKENNNLEFVIDFFKQRVEWLLKQKDIDYDVIESVMHIDHNNIPDLVHRALALQNFKKREDFIKLVLGFKRVSNIISEVKNITEIQPELLSEKSELKLYKEYLILFAQTNDLLISKSYEQILEKLVKYGKTIDRFFDDVLVNVDEEAIRSNRYNLLFKIRALFLQVADISKIVVDNEK